MKNHELKNIKVVVVGKDLNFELAKKLSEELLVGVIAEPMLIAWFDGIKGEEHPVVPECQHKPGWLTYGEGHGGKVRIDFNKNEYSLIYADASTEE